MAQTPPVESALFLSFNSVALFRHHVSLSLQVEAEGDVATAVTLARILSNIPLSRGGPTSVVIFDIHALQVLGTFCCSPIVLLCVDSFCAAC